MKKWMVYILIIVASFPVVIGLIVGSCCLFFQLFGIDANVCDQLLENLNNA